MPDDKICVHVVDRDGNTVGDIVLTMDTPEKLNYRAKRFSDRIDRITKEAVRAYKTLARCNEEVQEELARAWGRENTTDLFKRLKPLSFIGDDNIFLSVLTKAMENAVEEAFRENKQFVTVRIDV